MLGSLSALAMFVKKQKQKNTDVLTFAQTLADTLQNSLSTHAHWLFQHLPLPQSTPHIHKPLWFLEHPVLFSL